MSLTPYGDAIIAIETLFQDLWTGTEPVLWHHNSAEPVPSIASTRHWLHLAVEFDIETPVAFGAGPYNTERALYGVVVIRVFSSRGIGETDTLGLLDRALGVFRGQRVGALSFLGALPLQQPGASDDGGWWCRSGICSFVYRFRG